MVSVPAKRRYPTGPRVPMDAAFKAAVQRRLDEREITRAEFARQLGVTRGAITQFFGDQDSSTLVPAICELLQLPRPGATDDELAVLVAALSDDQRQLLLDLARQLSGKARRKLD